MTMPVKVAMKSAIGTEATPIFAICGRRSGVHTSVLRIDTAALENSRHARPIDSRPASVRFPIAANGLSNSSTICNYSE